MTAGDAFLAFMLLHMRNGIGPCSCGGMRLGEDYRVHLLAALRAAGLDVVEADRLASLERKNTNLGRLANGGVPDGYVLVKATEVEG